MITFVENLVKLENRAIHRTQEFSIGNVYWLLILLPHNDSADDNLADFLKTVLFIRASSLMFTHKHVAV
jgi:hypothetical protein